jgi:uncharacterized protein (TIGR03435 family)
MKPLLLIAASALVMLVQSEKPAGSENPAFDIATIKPHDPSGGVLAGTSISPRRYSGVGSLRSLIQTAYGVQDYQVSGGPSWVNTDLFEVDGRAANPTPHDQMMLMLQTLLAERFKLAIHRETKVVPIYALVAAKNGPKLQEVKDKDKIGAMSAGRGMLRGQMTLTDLARYLSSSAGRPVVERTGLTAGFEINLRWSPDNSPDAPGASLFTAIQEQLGLKLESAKGPIETLVIDHAEKPSGN